MNIRNIRITLKLALFAFLSAIVCVVANLFLGLLEVSYVAHAFLFISYICVVLWVCSYIGKLKTWGKNFIISFFTFAVALYAGIYSALVGEVLAASVSNLVFYITALICLISVVIWLGRWIFGNSSKVEAQQNAVAPVSESWTCNCGCVNTGRFCSECGASKPARDVVDEDPV